MMSKTKSPTRRMLEAGRAKRLAARSTPSGWGLGRRVFSGNKRREVRGTEARKPLQAFEHRGAAVPAQYSSGYSRVLQETDDFLRAVVGNRGPGRGELEGVQDFPRFLPVLFDRQGLDVLQDGLAGQLSSFYFANLGGPEKSERGGYANCFHHQCVR